ncbi:hypothetical protein A9K55_006493 [Cordyceps militaris]|uniref:AB hydrolase-1 domain-containing protein n=1 Tax=Cordyceps militaris TaxID=73501 RepID=A0A2H4SDA1_CORMI|nr:hypothetical protein A9K55_006493 [Cordyceps militaris]
MAPLSDSSSSLSAAPLSSKGVRRTALSETSRHNPVPRRGSHHIQILFVCASAVVALVFFGLSRPQSPQAQSESLVNMVNLAASFTSFTSFTSLAYWTQFAFAAANAQANTSSLADIVPKRDVLYVGGEYTNVTDAVTNATSIALIGQIYVEKLSPNPPLPPRVDEHRPLPIIFIAGAAQTGTNFLNTPDGRPGWASYFLSKGHTVYLSDQPSRGRSAWQPGGPGKFGTIGPPQVVSDIFTNTAQNGNQWPQAKLHTQWPGTGRMGDPTFDALYRSQVPLQTNRFISEEQNARAYAALVDIVGECFVISHSQAGAYGWRVGDMRPNLVKGIVQLEPSGPPFTLRPPFGTDPAFAFGLTDLPIAYDPPAGPAAELIKTLIQPAVDKDHDDCIMQTLPVKKLTNLARIPELVVTGEASFHAPYDYCTVAYLRQVGVDVEYADLGKEGIHGNGHMFFMEKNNIQIAERVYQWLQKH